MRIVVTSDVHLRTANLIDIVERHMEDADLFINLGDSEDEVDSLLQLYPNIKMERVAGNCDWYSKLPAVKIIEVAGKRVMFAHGHTFMVKHGYQAIEQRAREEKVDICLFGHTHVPYEKYDDGIYYLNPGAVCDGSYGIVDIVENGIIAYNTTI
jgi:hypothetical protein